MITTTSCHRSPNGYYRTGDASPTSNVCYRIPAGYYASAFAAGSPANTGAYEIAACPQGSFSSWDTSDLTWTAVNGGTQNTPSGTRTPAIASVCKVCDADSYATLTASTACATCPVSRSRSVPLLLPLLGMHAGRLPCLRLPWPDPLLATTARPNRPAPSPSRPTPLPTL